MNPETHITNLLVLRELSGLAIFEKNRGRPSTNYSLEDLKQLIKIKSAKHNLDNLLNKSFPEKLDFYYVKEIIFTFNFNQNKNDELIRTIFDDYSSLVFFLNDFIRKEGNASIYLTKFMRFYSMTKAKELSNKKDKLTKKDRQLIYEDILKKTPTSTTTPRKMNKGQRKWHQRTGIKRPKANFRKKVISKSLTKGPDSTQEKDPQEISYPEFLLTLLMFESRRFKDPSNRRIRFFSDEALDLFTAGWRQLSFVPLSKILEFVYFDQYDQYGQVKAFVEFLNVMEYLSTRFQSCLENYQKITT